ncbi:MAG: choice-of-anchor A family protein, partial [Acidobacteriota bacterium]
MLAGDPTAAGEDALVNQATAAGFETGPVLSDDPTTPTAGDPTVTPVVPSARPEVTIADVEVTEGVDAEALLTITLQSAASSPLTIDWQTAAIGEAEAGEDFTAAQDSLTLDVGDTSATVAVTILDDGRFEADERFDIVLTSADTVDFARDRATVTVLDDERCPSGELLVLPDPASTDRPEGWTPVLGADWMVLDDGAGGALFAAAAAPLAELAQSVDVSAFAPTIDAGALRFAFTALAASLDDPVLDEARVIVEFRDEAGAVLDAFDSGPAASSAGVLLTDERPAPAGTRRVRVRLLAEQLSDVGNDVVFQDVSLRALGAPTLEIADAVVAESDAELVFQLSLSCALDAPTTVVYSTVDGSAEADLDFAGATLGTAILGAGEVSAEIRVPVQGDALAEPAEHFFVVLDDVSTDAAVAVAAVDPEAIGVILDDDAASGCVGEPLDLAGDFNLFVFGDLIQSYTDVEGRVAVGGAAQFQSYEVGNRLTAVAGDLGSLVVGGSVTFSDGTVRAGDLVHGGAAQLVRVNIPDGQLTQASPIDFAAERTRYESMSLALAAAEVNGVTDVKPWGAITLTGTDAELNVFGLPSSDLASSVGLTIDVPAGSTALVNVDGAAVTMQNFGFFLQNGAGRERVVFNLHGATSLTMQGIGVQGSILAPFAAVQFSNGDVDGSLVAASFQGSGHLNHHPFAGCLPAGGAAGGGGDGDAPDFAISDGASSRPALTVGDLEVTEGDAEDVDGVV